MKVICYLIILICFGASCKSKEKNKYFNLLKGDWRVDSSNLEYWELGTTFSFEDTLCSLSNVYGFSKYTINNDTIIVQISGKGFLRENKIKQFGILSINSDTALLKLYTGVETKGDTLLLIKIKRENNLVPDEIFYESTGCKGTCPGVQIKIDSIGRISYFGNNKYAKEGGYVGLIDKNIYTKLLDKVQRMPLGTMKFVFGEFQRHVPEFGISLKQGDRYYTFVTNDIHGGPLELEICLRYLAQIHERVMLKSDSTITEDYFSLQQGIQQIAAGFKVYKDQEYKDFYEETKLYIKQIKASLPGLKKNKRELKMQEIELMEQLLKK